MVEKERCGNMEQPLDRIVGFDCLPEECINKDLLYTHTKRVGQ